MVSKTSIAALLHELDERSPSGCAIALHITFSAPRFMVQTYSKPWLDFYNAKGLLLNDPVVRWGFQNNGFARWSELEAIDTDGVLEHAKDFGLMNGVAISVVSSKSRSIAGFARADRDYSDEEISDLTRLLGRLHAETENIDPDEAADAQALADLSVRLTH